jgi:hypothetical protein
MSRTGRSAGIAVPRDPCPVPDFQWLSSKPILELSLLSCKIVPLRRAQAELDAGAVPAEGLFFNQWGEEVQNVSNEEISC